jgi:hypothetical protein
MDELILNAWDKYNHLLKDYFRKTKQSEYSYFILLKKTLEIIFNDDYLSDKTPTIPDFTKVTEIDHYGYYHGTLVFVIVDREYMPDLNNYWYTSVEYGSCSACDTLESIRHYDSSLPDEAQIEEYWTLCLHLMQKMKRMQ